MAHTKTRVDILTLEDFRGRLQAHLTSAQSVVATLTTKLVPAPGLGGFYDATTTASDYNKVYREHVQRATRLVAAIEAAQTATDRIIHDYRTTEARNTTDQADIAKLLGQVINALGGPLDGR